eukprot:6217802-Amphidinium_carterae.1
MQDDVFASELIWNKLRQWPDIRAWAKNERSIDSWLCHARLDEQDWVDLSDHECGSATASCSNVFGQPLAEETGFTSIVLPAWTASTVPSELCHQVANMDTLIECSWTVSDTAHQVIVKELNILDRNELRRFPKQASAARKEELLRWTGQ